MKIKFACIVATLLFFSGTEAQNRHGLYGQQLGGFRTTLTLSVGPAYLFGDPGVLENKQGPLNFLDYRILDTRLLYSLGLRHIFSNNVGIKATVFYGTFAGTDELSKFEERGYSFKSTIYEFAIQGEYILLGGPNSGFLSRHTLYLYAGAGVMYSKPELRYSTDKKYTRNNDVTNYILKTHAPGRDNDSVSLDVITPAFPFGFGYQYQLSNNISLGVEFGYQYFFSDFIDGLKTEKSTKKDVLASLSFSVSYKINKGNARGKQIQWW